MKNNQSPQLKKTLSFAGPRLSVDLVHKIIQLQDQCRKSQSQECIVELTYNYKKLIEHYSGLQDNISIYFQQRMQSLLSSQRTINIIDKMDEIPSSRMASSDVQEEVNPNTKMKLQEQSIGKYDVDSKRKERSKKANIYIEANRTNKKNNAPSILNNYYQECVENNKLIHREQDVQRKELEDRLKSVFENSKARKKNSDGKLRDEDSTAPQDSTSESIYVS